MFTSNYRLPNIERPTEKILDDDEKEVMTALNILLNGYKIAQKRVRDITRAYNELETLTLKILKNQNGEDAGDKKSSITKGAYRVQSSTPKCEDNVKKSDHIGKDVRGVEMIDLTSLFDAEKSINPDDSIILMTSPILSERQEENVKKNSTNDSAEKKRDIERFEISRVDDETIDRSIKFGNEENKPPSSDEKIDETSSLDVSRTVSKLTRTTTIYKIEMPKNSSGKMMKQSTLVFQPIGAKSVNKDEKIVTKNAGIPGTSVNLFDEDYRTRKRHIDISRKRDIDISRKRNIDISRKRDIDISNKRDIDISNKRDIDISNIDESKKDKVKNLPTRSLMNDTGKIVTSTRIDGSREPTIHRKPEVSLVVPTASQIDETARSLFEDDDDDVDGDIIIGNLDNYLMSDEKKIADNRHSDEQNVEEKRKSIFHPIPSTSRLSNTPESQSIDETFFAPAEINKNYRKAGLDRPMVKKIDVSRSLKRKPEEEPIIDAGKEMDELALNDINWDAEVSNDDWSSPQKAFNNSFDIPPPKAKKSPEYAHKGNVVRNKAKRSKLRGWNCWDCEKYYGNMNLPEEELQKRMDACSRHRAKYNPRYFTPKDFWNPEFPDNDDSSDDG